LYFGAGGSAGNRASGVYWSDELETVWRIVDIRRKMFLEFEGGTIPILGTASEGYRAGPASLKPRLSESGEITGLEVSTGRARGIFFVRR
jgi:hypothetical protein